MAWNRREEAFGFTGFKYSDEHENIVNMTSSYQWTASLWSFALITARPPLTGPLLMYPGSCLQKQLDKYVENRHKCRPLPNSTFHNTVKLHT